MPKPELRVWLQQLVPTLVLSWSLGLKFMLLVALTVVHKRSIKRSLSDP